MRTIMAAPMPVLLAVLTGLRYAFFTRYALFLQPAVLQQLAQSVSAALAATSQLLHRLSRPLRPRLAGLCS